MRDWKNWIKKAGVRAIKTVCQTAVATIGVATVMSEVNWIAVGSASVLAGVLSILTSVAGIPEEGDNWCHTNWKNYIQSVIMKKVTVADTIL